MSYLFKKVNAVVIEVGHIYFTITKNSFWSVSIKKDSDRSHASVFVEILKLLLPMSIIGNAAALSILNQKSIITVRNMS